MYRMRYIYSNFKKKKALCELIDRFLKGSLLF